MMSYEELVKENQSLSQKLVAADIALQKAQPSSATTSTQSLIKSIDKLKKDLLKEKQLHKDNVRIKMIEKQKSELADQEKIINALREEIGDEERCDKAILKMLNEGPKRIRDITKEDLKIEIRKLRSAITKGNMANQSQALPLEANQSIEQLITGIEQKEQSIVTLKNELDTTKIELTVKAQELEKLQKQIALLKASKI